MNNANNNAPPAGGSDDEHAGEPERRMDRVKTPRKPAQRHSPEKIRRAAASRSKSEREVAVHDTRKSNNTASAPSLNTSSKNTLRAVSGKLLRHTQAMPVSVADTDSCLSSIEPHVSRHPDEALAADDAVPSDGAQFAMVVQLLRELVDGEALVRAKDLEAAQTLLSSAEGMLSRAKPSAANHATRSTPVRPGNTALAPRSATQARGLQNTIRATHAASEDDAMTAAANADIEPTSSLTSVDAIDEERRPSGRSQVTADNNSAIHQSPSTNAQTAADDDDDDYSERPQILIVPSASIKQPQQGTLPSRYQSDC